MEKMYEIQRRDLSRLVSMYMDAFSEYPKLMGAFKQRETRLAALEATLWYYCAYDICFGRGLALDEELNEAVIFVHSDEMGYTEERHAQAGSCGREYRAAMARLTGPQQQMRIELFEEMDSMEEEIDIPEPHLYVDFLGVRKSMHHQGRGRRLMERVFEIAEEKGLPVMLFTNSAEDVAFYESLGFKEIGHTRSEKFGFENVYLRRDIPDKTQETCEEKQEAEAGRS